MFWHTPLIPINTTIWKVPVGSAVPDLDRAPGQELPQDGSSQLSCLLAETQTCCCDSEVGFSSTLKEPKITLQREMLLLAPVLQVLPSHQGQRLPMWQGHGRDMAGHLGQRHGGVSAGGAKGAALGQQCRGSREQRLPEQGWEPGQLWEGLGGT